MGFREPTVLPQFQQVAELLAIRAADGTELGASLCVLHDDRVVLDTWAGFADKGRTVPWSADTITPVWSTTKTVVALAVLLLVDAGKLDLHAPVATYWPEFAQHGKDKVTIAQLLNHSSGVPAWSQQVSISDLYDWKYSTQDLAESELWWEPGSQFGYHMLNQGHLLGAVIERVTGLRPGEFIAAELAGPLEADFHLGLAPADDARVSPVTPPRLLEQEPPDVQSIAFRVLTQPFLHVRESASESWKREQVPAANGHANARAIAEIQSLISHGGVRHGRQFLSSSTIDEIFTDPISGTDLVLGLPLRFGLGWALPNPEVMPSVPTGRRCYWGGLGGSVVVNDLESRTTIAYVMNSMKFEYAPHTRVTRPCGDSRSDEYFALIWETLGGTSIA